MRIQEGLMADKFVWYELMTSNAFETEAFYREVVGWSARDAGMTGMKYIIMSIGERPMAGLVQFPEDAPQSQQGKPGWLGYIGVADVDAKAAAAEKLGAKVLHAPTDIPDIGLFAVIMDPQGVCFALFTPNGSAEPVAPMTQGTIGWHELHTNAADKAFAFYSTLFGWKSIQEMDMGPLGTYQIFGDDTTPMGFGGMFNDTEAAHPYWLYYFFVPDIDAGVARVKAAGGKIVREPAQVPGGAWIIHAHDVLGSLFALVGMRETSAAA
jgi:uncharacterized protein